MKKIIAIVFTFLFVIAIGGGLAGCYGFNGFDNIIGSQNLDFPAAVENLGSTVIIVAPLSIASDISCICPLCIFSPKCEPISTMQRVSRISIRSGEYIISPKVVRKPTSRGPRHCANEGAAIVPEPYAFNICPAIICF